MRAWTLIGALAIALTLGACAGGARPGGVTGRRAMR